MSMIAMIAPCNNKLCLYCITMIILTVIPAMTTTERTTCYMVHSFIVDMIPQQHHPKHRSSLNNVVDNTRIQQQQQQQPWGKMKPIATSITATSTSTTPTTPIRMIEYMGEERYQEWAAASEERIQEQIALVPSVQIVTTMPNPISMSINPYQNHYYLLRHGQSTANVDEIISSDRTTLSYTMKHGLTELGYEQGTNSALQLLSLLLQQTQQKDEEEAKLSSHHRIMFISSPFARARQTAYACYNGLLDLISNDVVMSSITNNKKNVTMTIAPTILLNNLLVERYFGIYDNDALYTYGYIWPLDAKNVTHTAHNVESVAAVATRIQHCIAQIESYIQEQQQQQQQTNDDHIQNHIVLVSHGDVLQIAQLYAANVPNVGEFSSYRFQNGEIRRMLFNDTSALPTPVPLQPPPVQ